MERVISKIATDFRNDVHRAKSGTMPISGERLHRELDLDLGEGTHIRYQADQHRLTRELVKGDTVMAREDFRLPDCQPHLSPEFPANPNLRTLSIERPSSTITRDSRAPRPLRPLVIDAYLNRWPVPQANLESDGERNAPVQDEKVPQ
ncbi:hypothetical protein [Schlesneria paludicola]|uniref:hypothetical protein n=1 Tax=Schlesneria paludicola TaxID=360056 RepID=UPI00031537A7|nr:hypothetical protein [Schlesneria paludicola]